MRALDPMRCRSAAVLATGVVSGLGGSMDALWSGLLGGRCAVLDHDLGDGEEPVRGGLVPPEALEDRKGAPLERSLALVGAALREVVASPAWQQVDPRELGICVGTTQGGVLSWVEGQRRLADGRGGPTGWPWLSDPARHLARLTGAQGPVDTPSLACASGAAALGIGLSWLRRGLCRHALCGGVDSFSRFVFRGFQALKALDPVGPRPFDQRRAGLAVGEGAGLVLLGADAAGQRCVPRLVGWGGAADANHLTGPDREGAGLVRAVSAALEDAGVEARSIGYINAHGTATQYNDLMESKAFGHVLGPAVDRVPVSSIKGSIGHTMGAAGAIEAAACVRVLQRGLIPATTGLEVQDPEIRLDVVQGGPRRAYPRIVLSTNSGFGGLNTALVLGNL